jgi:hypothetical protein
VVASRTDETALIVNATNAQVSRSYGCRSLSDARFATRCRRPSWPR